MTATPTAVRRSTSLVAPREALFNLLEDPRMADRINPAFLVTTVVDTPWLPKPGSQTVVALSYRGVEIDLTTELAEYRRGHFLLERQASGPFAAYEHAVSLEDGADGATQVTEVLVYSVGFGLLGRAFNRVTLRRDLETTLDHRHRRLGELFELGPG